MNESQLHEADMINAVERVRGSRLPNPGGPAGYIKRKRSIWRAIKRGDFAILVRIKSEMGIIQMMRRMADILYAHAHEQLKSVGLASLLNREAMTGDPVTLVYASTSEKADEE